MKKKLIALMSVLTIAICSCTTVCAADIGSTSLFTGTKSLFEDLTKALMILSPIIGTALIIYFLIRKSGADEVDQKKWKSAIAITAVCMIGVVAASAVINAILGYYN